MVGSRQAKRCGAVTDGYFASIDECVPSLILSSSEFVDAIQVENICYGDVVDSLFKLEQLRFCSSIITPLDIVIDDARADYTALRDIRAIHGLSQRKCLYHNYANTN